MKGQTRASRCLFSLTLAASILLGGFAESGRFEGQFLVSGLTAAPRPAAHDGREGWKLVNNGLHNLTIAALAIDPVNPTRIYAGTIGGGFFKSTDGGSSWSNIGLNARFGTALAINFANPDVVYAGTADGGVCNANRPLFTSTNGGASWSNQSSMADCDISLIVIDPTSPRTLYAGSLVQYLETGSTFLWNSTDGGGTWNRIDNEADNIGLGPYGSYGLAINPANPQILYAPGDLYANGRVTDSGLFMSADGGTRWHPTGLKNAYIRAVAIDPLNSGTLYAGSANNHWAERPIPYRGIFKSTDGGASWFAINNGLSNITYITSIVIDRDNTNILYIGSDGGVFKSVNGGASWSAFNDGLTNLEVFDLALAPGHPNTLYAGTRIGVFKVSDNTTGLNPIDDAQFFVRQHYLDFLGREPDPAGLAFWVNEITSCGADAQCVDIKRQHVSAAFFLSIEFQETGYFVYRTYKVAYGDTTSPNVFIPVPILRVHEFVPDAQRVGQGVQVGIGEWEGQLEANKNSYASEFVTMRRFLTAYPLTMSAVQFVDELNQNAGDVLSLAERDDLIVGLNAAADVIVGRATVLLRVAENAALRQREKNRAFVLMQYYGYLRRNPDGPPDSDFRGWEFWFNKLKQFNGNFIEAEMVKAFLVSSEYRQRFGQP